MMPKILLVEDNEMNRDMLSRRLVRNGFEVVMAVDGQQGVEMAASEKPDLILMDMSLPVMDGWEATRRVKADAATKAIPVIALTAHAMLQDKEGDGGRLRRLRHQTGRDAAPAGQDQRAAERWRVLVTADTVASSAGRSSPSATTATRLRP
jgi:two-component system cell cycle response regulator DivK